MPKNKGAGGKNRRKGKSNIDKPKELVYKKDGQEYAQITKSLGNGYMEVICFTTDGNLRKRAHIRGNMRKRVWMAVGDIVLVSIRNYQDTICDIELKYTSDQVRILRSRNQLPDNIDINKKDMIADDNAIVFAEDTDEEDELIEYISKQNRNLEMPTNDSDEENDNIDDL